MLENHDNVDPERVGIMGWSHGGLITLMNLFAHPKEFKVGYAGVPVCDLVARMGYSDQAYRDLFFRYLPHWQDGPRRHSRVSPPAARLECRQTAVIAADPHDDERRRRERAGGREPDQRAQGRGQEVRARDLQGRTRRASVQSTRYQVRQGVASESVPLLGQTPQSAQSNQVNPFRIDLGASPHDAHRLDHHVLDRHVSMSAEGARRYVVDLVHDIQALDNSAEHAIAHVISHLALVEELVVLDVDEKLRRGAVGLDGSCHGDRATLVGKAVGRLVFDWLAGFAFLQARLHAAALDHEVRDDPVENESVIVFVLDVLQEILDGHWRLV